MKILVALAALLASAASASSQVLLHDDFNDATIDVGLWTVTTPYPDALVQESSGYLKVLNRGRVLTTSAFDAPYQIEGRILLADNPFSPASVVLRTDGSSIGAAEMPGIAVQLGVRRDDAVVDQLQIYTIGAAGSDGAAASLTTALNMNQWYDFRIVDNGTSVHLYWDNAETATLSLASSWSTGDRIGFYNREGGGGGSFISDNGSARLDHFTVSSVPEPRTYGIIFSAALGLLCFRSRRIKALLGERSEFMSEVDRDVRTTG